MSEGRQTALNRLGHIRGAAAAINGYVERGRAAYDDDPAVGDAILYQLIVIGEAAKGVMQSDASLVEELPDVEWSLLAKMRDRLTHRYWATDPEIVWATATPDVPTIHASVSAALDRL